MRSRILIALFLGLAALGSGVSFQASVAAAQEACQFEPGPGPIVQWAVAEGGNGHYYQRLCHTETTGVPQWPTLQSAAEAAGKYLVTLTSQAEQDFVADPANDLLVPAPGPAYWAGGFQPEQPPGQTDPAVGWQWVTGEPWVYTNWDPAIPEPNDGGGDFLENNAENHLNIHSETGFWNDQNGFADFSVGTPRYILEWEDADADTIPNPLDNCPDAANPGQEDSDSDGIGDVCDTLLTITKVCLGPADGDADFNLNVELLDVSVASDVLECGDVLAISNPVPGSYGIEEVITGADAGSFLTAIACTGQSAVQGRRAQVSIEGGFATKCTILNFFNPPADLTDPAAPPAPPTIIVPIDLDNTNTNTLDNVNDNSNNNENTNTQEQSNHQEQINDNNQTTTVNSSPSVVIDFDE